MHIMKAKKYIIIDWASNHIFKEHTFEDIDDGIEFLYENVKGDKQDYFIVKERSDGKYFNNPLF